MFVFVCYCTCDSYLCLVIILLSWPELLKDEYFKCTPNFCIKCIYFLGTPKHVKGNFRVVQFKVLNNSTYCCIIPIQSYRYIINDEQ